MMPDFVRRLWACTRGAALVEFSIFAGFLLTLTFGMIEFSLALHQYNSASKAAELGARLAAVSNPIWEDMRDWTGLGTGVNILDPFPAFDIVCDASTLPVQCIGPLSCNGASDCPATGPMSAAAQEALEVIVYGRDASGDPSPTCGGIGADLYPGMCDIYPNVTLANVEVEYLNSGLGFAGRPGGPVPTIVLRLQNLQFQFVALNGLMGLGPINMPDFEVTITGEDMNLAAPL